MTVIYFPYTWADASTIQAISAVFPRIAIYQPRDCSEPSSPYPFKETGNLEIRVPIIEDGKKIEMMVADYQSWARLHQGSDLRFLKVRQPAAPFIDHLSSQIQSDILQYQDASAEPAADPVFNARLFLEIAAAYDAQQAGLNCDLANVRILEKRFIAALGDAAEMEEPPPIGNLPLVQEDPADFMIAERLQAWSLLLLQDRRQRTANEPWVTCRLSVIEWIQNEIGMEQVLEINCIPIPKIIDENTRFWQESIQDYLAQLQKMPWPSAVKTFEPPFSDYAWENAVSVRGYIIPDLTPDAFLVKMSSDKSARLPVPDQPRNTLILCVAPL